MAFARDVSFERAHIVARSLESGEQRTLIDGGAFGRYASTGHLVYAKGTALLAAPFDPGALEIRGTPVTVLNEVLVAPFFGLAHVALADDGTLVYVPSIQTPPRRFLWVDRAGAEQPIAGAPRVFLSPRLSPDGQRVATILDEATTDLWTLDLARGAMTRITPGDGTVLGAVWSPDGRELAYTAQQTGRWTLFRMPADNSAPPRPIVTSDSRPVPLSWSPDSRSLVIRELSFRTRYDLSLLPLADQATPVPLLQSVAPEDEARISPDGRWLAYTVGGERTDVYVQPFPGPGGKTLISTEGGRNPAWSPDGREIFYRNGRTLMAVSISTRPTLSAGVPHVLFEGPYEGDYDVSPDGPAIPDDERRTAPRSRHDARGARVVRRADAARSLPVTFTSALRT